MIRSLDIAKDGAAIDALLFTPADATGPLPGVVLFSDIGGARVSFHEKAQRVADAGYAVLLPNIYYRRAKAPVVPKGKSFLDPDMMPMVRGYAGDLTPDALAGDFAALVGAMDAAPEIAGGGIAAVGYCLTGGFALRMAARHPDRIIAAAGFHSARLAPDDGADSPVTIVGGIAARVYLGHADNDDFLTADQIGRLDQALAAAGVHFQTELYKGARHGWTTTDHPAYDAAADALHFKRLFTLLEETIAG